MWVSERCALRVEGLRPLERAGAWGGGRKGMLKEGRGTPQLPPHSEATLTTLGQFPIQHRALP